MLKRLSKKMAAFLGDFESCAQDAHVFQKDHLSKILPYVAFDEAHGLFINKKSIGFVFEMMPIVSFMDEIQKDLHGILQDVLPEKSSIQFLLWADHRINGALQSWAQPRHKKGGILSEIAQHRVSFFNALFDKKGEMGARIFKVFISVTQEAEPENPVALKSMCELKEKIYKLLSNYTGIAALNAHDFMRAIDGFINVRWNPHMPSAEWNPFESLSYQLPSKETVLKIYKDVMGLDDDTIACKTYGVKRYPDYWTLAGMKDLIGDDFKDFARISCPFWLHYGVHILPQESAQERFFNKIKIVEHQGRSSKLVKTIPSLEAEIQEYAYTRRQLHKGERMIWTHMTVGIFDKREDVSHSDQMIKSIFRNKNWVLEENRYTHLPCYMSCLPMMWGEGIVQDLREMGSLKTTLTSEASNVIPIIGEWQGTQSDGMLLTGRKGQLFTWYPFDNKNGNYNVVVVGRSGSGKSVFMQELLVSTLGLGGRVFVLDVGRSFERTCLLLQGQFIAFGKSEKLCLNPFTNIPLDDTDAQEDTFAMLKSILCLMAAPTKKTDDFENALMERAIRICWDEHTQKTTITHISDWLLSQNEKRAKDLGTMLTSYTKMGVYGRYFEGDNNINFDNPMVVIELEELKEKKDLQSVVLQMFIMTITNKMFLGDRKTPFHICIDEAWDLLRGEQTGVFVETLARRLRKYNGSLVIGTQSVNDFYASPGALASFENSDWMCLLAQRKESIDCLKNSNRLSMDYSMEAALKSVSTLHGQYSEVMIYNAQDGYAIGRLRLDPFSGLLYSTKADEYNQIKDLQGQGMSITEAITTLMARRAA